MTKTYKTIQGDTWDMIAFKALGSEKYTDLIIYANLEQKNVVIFSSSIELVIPDILEPRKNENLPPWKR